MSLKATYILKWLPKKYLIMSTWFFEAWFWHSRSILLNWMIVKLLFCSITPFFLFYITLVTWSCPKGNKKSNLWIVCTFSIFCPSLNKPLSWNNKIDVLECSYLKEKVGNNPLNISNKLNPINLQSPVIYLIHIE